MGCSESSQSRHVERTPKPVPMVSMNSVTSHSRLVGERPLDPNMKREDWGPRGAESSAMPFASSEMHSQGFLRGEGSRNAAQTSYDAEEYGEPASPNSIIGGRYYDTEFSTSNLFGGDSIRTIRGPNDSIIESDMTS